MEKWKKKRYIKLMDSENSGSDMELTGATVTQFIKRPKRKVVVSKPVKYVSRHTWSQERLNRRKYESRSQQKSLRNLDLDQEIQFSSHIAR